MGAEPNSGLEIGAIVGWTFAFFGLICTLIGWYVRGSQMKKLAVKKDMHESIDKAIKALTDFEDSSLSFWTEKDTKFTQNHILILHRRLVVSCKQVSELCDKEIPNDFLIALRKYATLEFEQAKRPISAKSERVMQISYSCSRLLNSSYLMKSWKQSHNPK